MIRNMVCAAACALAATSAQAATTVTVDTAGTRVVVNGAEAADGQRLGGAEFNGSTDPAPFDLLIGRDSQSNFSAAWTQSYAAITGTIVGATVRLGIFDVDGDVAGDQVGLFTLNGFDLTAALNVAVNAKAYTGDSLYGIYDVMLSSDTYAALATGNLNFALALSGPARNVLGSTRFNAGILDYSQVTITSGTVTPPTPPTPPVQAVPESTTWAMLMVGFGALGGMLRRRHSRGLAAA